ncbi:sulfatase-like hydrolase/transferase [Janthinobacterium agaricidamnosum]|uniref:sulfatase-like hydrolase/transferase n=1 Tax=Janthinobacterium agaricidamnosum TaxID=55508 RepID=UPI003204D031
MAVEPDLVRPVRHTRLRLCQGSGRGAIPEPGRLYQQLELRPDPVRSVQECASRPGAEKTHRAAYPGSHWNYSQRYPKSFDKWQPSLFGVDKPVYTDTAIKPQLNNSYDSSILYTDWFLSNVIGMLKDDGQRTALRSSLVYVADHGQTLYDGTCRLAFHGHNTQFEFHVPPSSGIRRNSSSTIRTR